MFYRKLFIWTFYYTFAFYDFEKIFLSNAPYTAQTAQYSNNDSNLYADWI